MVWMGRAIKLRKLHRGDGKTASATNDAACYKFNAVNDEYIVSNRQSANAIQLVQIIIMRYN